MTVRGDYGTGSPADIGWMLPFFFAAWAAASLAGVLARGGASSPTRPLPHASPVLLFVALLGVPIVGYRPALPDAARRDGRHAARHRDRVHAGRRYRARAGAPARRAAPRPSRPTSGCGCWRPPASRRANWSSSSDGTAASSTRTTRSAAPPATPTRSSSRSPRARWSPPNRRLRSRSSTEPEDAKGDAHQRVAARARTAARFQAACVAAPIVDAGGRVTHFVAVIRDTTEELRLREQLVRGERLSALGEFVSGVAHEINNPLQSIIGSLELRARPASRAAALRVDIERARARGGARRTHRAQPAALRPPCAERAAAPRSQRNRQGDDERPCLRAGDRRHPDSGGVRAAAAAGAGQPRRDSAGDRQPRDERAAGDVGSHRRARAVGAHVHVGR